MTESGVTQQCGYSQCSDTTNHSVAPCNTTKDKVKIIIHESTSPKDSASWGTIGKFTRKARKHTYVSPRLLLPRDFSEHIGKTVRIYKAKLSVEGSDFWKNKDALILVLREPCEEPTAHMILPKKDGA